MVDQTMGLNSHNASFPLFFFFHPPAPLLSPFTVDLHIRLETNCFTQIFPIQPVQRLPLSDRSHSLLCLYS